ncbi:MAG: AMP-dependent synthetase/ligase [Vicinamibacterales bacterium]
MTDSSAELRTIADLPFYVTGRYPRETFVGRSLAGGIQWLSTKDFFERIRDLSLGLSALGLARGDRAAILSESRPEWLLVDLAILTAGGVTVPVYPTLGAHQARYIFHDAGARWVFVSTAAQAEKVQQVRHELPALEAIILIEPGGSAGGSVLTLDDLAARGHARIVASWGVAREYKDAARAIQPGDLATLIYTSGTTGEPKGVMLTHANLASNMQASVETLRVADEDVALSFLPLSHAFERLVAYVYLSSGTTLVFAESIDTLARDIAAVRPTVMTAVPRVFEKLHARITEKGSTGPLIKRLLFKWAIRKARRGGLFTGLADRLVLRKIREGLGGRLKFLVSGSAPLSKEIAEFFQACGFNVLEGYGLTEASPVLTVNPPGAPRLGTVGRAVRGVELRIAEDGEILARGPNIMAGYYNKPEATAAALDNGWLHTGDIGELDAEGYLTITDRKKDLLVTSGGKKIAPQPIERRLKASPLVGEAVLIGDRRKYPAALIVPDFAILERRLRDLDRPPASREELAGRADVRALYQELVDALNRELAQFERIKRVAILPREFTIESGELTPTLKVKRKVVEERYRDTIANLYSDE